MRLGIIDLLGLAGFDQAAAAKMVRHQHDQYPVRELLRGNWLDLYQSYQSRPVFHKCDYIVAFYGLTGTRACLYGVFRKLSVSPSHEGPAPESCPWAAEWRTQSRFHYDLERQSGFEDLEDRVIIDWGRGVLAWHQRLTNKPVLEVAMKGRRLPPFDDYLDFSLSFTELRELAASPEAHRDWYTHLHAVGGIYLIVAERTGEQYVGSASGDGGIWSRWSDYARTGHGGNLLLRQRTEADPDYAKSFRFSLLQILPKTTTTSELVNRESRFKEKLGSRAHGLNSN